MYILVNVDYNKEYCGDNYYQSVLLLRIWGYRPAVNHIFQYSYYYISNKSLCIGYSCTDGWWDCIDLRNHLITFNSIYIFHSREIALLLHNLTFLRFTLNSFLYLTTKETHSTTPTTRLNNYIGKAYLD